MTEVNVSVTVGNVCDSGGNIRNSGEIEHVLENLILEIFIYKSA